MQNISTVVLTKNEEKNIARCLKSVMAVSDDVVVMDCFSQDNTVEIAREYTDNVFQNPWPGFAEQRKIAIAKTKHDWVLWIDADEELSDDLMLEIKSLTFDCDGYYIPRMVYYLGRWIRHGGWYPDYTMRLFNKRKGQMSDVRVHESFSVTGKTSHLKAPLFHYPYRDIAHHIEKMNSYTSLAAVQMKEKGRKATIFSALTHGLSRFFKMYLLKMGFCDGRQGFVIAVLGSIYVFMKYIKCWSLTRAEK